MSDLERLAAAPLFPAFEGVEPPDWVRRWIGAGLGGVVLFSRNVADAEQVAALTAALHAERPDLLVATDEEGGDVTRLEVASGSSYPGNYALGAVDDVELTERVAGAIGSDLARVGINLDLAPVADVDANPLSPIVGIRAFGSDSRLAARHVAAFVLGMQRIGVAACAKHFPGHGATAADSHAELPAVEVTEEALLPFRAAVDAGVQVVMTGHLLVGDEPATLSREVTEELLRGRLGFFGLVLTDALEMGAISRTVGVEEAAVRALSSGADALCLGRDLGEKSVESVHRAVVEAVRAGRLGEERLREAAGRVGETARWASRPSPDPSLPREVGLDAARRALRVEGRAVLTRPPRVVELLPEPSMAADEPRHGLAEILGGEAGGHAGKAGMAFRRHRKRCLSGEQLVVVVQDAHRHAWQREAVESLLDDDAIVVEIGVPVWRPGRAAGYVATHGVGRVNLEAAAERLLARSQHVDNGK
jgi:beta-N-acetylhexosaminidase